MTLTEFLLARIAEDEADFRDKFDTSPPEPDAPDWLRWGIAECEAKRRIVEYGQRAALEPEGSHFIGYRAAIADALRALALPYADHPDYREEWGA